MSLVGRALVDGNAERMFILLSYSSVMRLTVLTKEVVHILCVCILVRYDHWHGAAYKHMLSTHTHS